MYSSQFPHLLHGTAAHVTADIWLTPQLLTQIHEFMRSEVIAVGHISPMGIDAPRAFFPWADTVLPMVIIGKTASWPTQIGDVDLPQRLDHIIADATLIWDRGVLATQMPP